ncbi:MAG: hypothetical protein R2705_16880 [Ilumatobacteraceae bacterium]
MLLTEMEISMPRGLRKLPRTFIHHLSGPRFADFACVLARRGGDPC